MHQAEHSHVQYDEHMLVHELGEEQESEPEEAPCFLGHLERSVPRSQPKLRKLNLLAHLHFPNGAVKEVEALVDTGAEINIINPKFVPDGAFENAKKPLRVGMANAVCLKGGKREASFALALRGVDIDSRQGVEIRVPTTAYDGEMVCDLILSYAWLAQQNVLVNPRRHGILFQEENRMVWIPGLNIVSQWDIQKGDGSTIIASPVVISEDTMHPTVRTVDPQERKSDDQGDDHGEDHPCDSPMGGSNINADPDETSFHSHVGYECFHMPIGSSMDDHDYEMSPINEEMEVTMNFLNALALHAQPEEKGMGSLTFLAWPTRKLGTE